MNVNATRYLTTGIAIASFGVLLEVIFPLGPTGQIARYSTWWFGTIFICISLPLNTAFALALTIDESDVSIRHPRIAASLIALGTGLFAGGIGLFLLPIAPIPTIVLIASAAMGAYITSAVPKQQPPELSPEPLGDEKPAPETTD